MSFENHIFISYAHIDNQTLTDGQQGWISEFHHALQVRLAQLRGDRPKIWRDQKLTGSDYFGDVIVKELSNAALLLSVFSPRYVKSEWCLREFKEFQKAAGDRGGVRVGDKYRILKVVKTPVERAEQPSEVQDILGYEFFQEESTGRPREFDPKYGAEAEINYFKKLDDLAYDVCQLLKLLEHPEQIQAIAPVNQPSSELSAIYLAETTYDLRDARSNIRRELQQRGHRVLPDEVLPYSPEFSDAVMANLAQCRLSIHLVGSRYGIVPEGAEQSVVELQHQLAVTYCQQQVDASVLVWMPDGLEAEEPRQDAFIRRLQDGAELLQTSLEDFKTIIQDTLNPTVPKPVAIESGDRPTQIYLVCDQRDVQDYDATIQPLEDALWEQGFEVIPSVFDGDEAEVRRYHHDSLVDCDAVMIYWNAGSEAWLRTKLRELQQAPGFGRTEPLQAKAIYISGEQSSAKQRFRTREATTIKQFGAFSPTDLNPFITQIQSNRGGRSG
ncbi:MAG: TIR domain-containing protein [Cyanobacteria bacterium P01_E01_bin.6]